MATAADVPHKYDLLVGSEGYVLYDPFRNDANAPQKATHTFSPAFVPRTNVEGNYGDDKQEFFLTFSMKDWSLGEDQKFARASDNTSRRYWRGSFVDVTTPGEVSLRTAATTRDSATTSGITAITSGYTGVGSRSFFWADDTNFYKATTLGTEDTPVAFNASITSGATCMTWDGKFVYASKGASTVQSWDSTASVSTTFSATGADALSYLNNALYGYRNNAGTLVRYSTAGVATVLHTWQFSEGTAITTRSFVSMRPFGGKLLIQFSNSTTPGGTELWIYDGVGVSLVHSWESGFRATNMVVSNGIVYICGLDVVDRITFPSVYYYANGQVGLLWQGKDAASSVDIATYDSGVAVAVANLAGSTRLLYYSSAQGGVSTLADFSSVDPIITANFAGIIVFDRGTDDFVTFAGIDPAATTATVTSSLIDFDSSLQKFFRGIKVDYDEATTGDGGSVDIAYRLNDLDSTYTTLQTGSVAGTEYLLGSPGSEVIGRSLSVKLTLNKGTSTAGPVLKRMYLRASPLVNNYHRAEYWLHIGGRDGASPVVLRDGSYEPRDGLEMAHDLKDAATSSSLLTIVDKFESFTGIVESCELIEVRPEEFVARVLVREV